MTRVKQRTGVARDTRTSVTHEISKVAFGILVVTAVAIGLVSFASLGVGITKAVLMIIGA